MAVKVHKERRQLMVQEHLVREIEVVLMGILEQQRLPTLPVVEVVLAQLAVPVRMIITPVPVVSGFNLR